MSNIPFPDVGTYDSWRKKGLNNFNKFDLNSTPNFFLQISVLIDKIKRGVFSTWGISADFKEGLTRTIE